MPQDSVNRNVATDAIINQYSEFQLEQLSQNLAQLYDMICRGEFSTAHFGVNLITTVHERIWVGVVDHAGRIRTRDWGAEYLDFGPNRSEHRNAVREKLETLCHWVDSTLRRLEENSDAPEYELNAYTVAAFAQAELVRIHPFMDGNGRIGRALTDIVLVRLGFGVVRIDAVKDEYYATLNVYHTTKKPDEFVDLLLQCANPDFSKSL
ncbi:MAG: Fic family protein [Myxococcales bacterium]|nr:Fic family protein [Myxococcales bacterium]